MLSSLLATILITPFSLSTISYCSPAPSERQLRSHSFDPRHERSLHDGGDYTTDQKKRVDAVIDQFRFAWNGYYTYAYPHDDYFPQNSSFSDSRNGWGLTMIDSLDTAILMEQTDIVDIILDFIPTVDFTKNNARPANGPSSTSLFETNIRYLGGMLGAYDLLKGPFSHLVSDEDRIDTLLSQAVTLADSLKFAFDTPTGIPINDVYINNQSFTDDELQDDGTYVAGLAELGTLVLEWQHLSDLTGDSSYGDLAQKAESYWFDASEIWPGLTGSSFSVETGQILDKYGGWTSGNDSAYEYLIKMYVYDRERYANYSERWQAAADSTIAHLIGHPSSRPDLTMAGSFIGKQMQNYSEQLACFIGGNFILGGTVLDDPKYVKYGLDFADFCANGYQYAASGIGPTLYSWNTSLLQSTSSFRNQSRQYERAGWFIPDNDSLGNGQTPEAVESWYYAYQATGDQYWRDVAWAYTLAQNRTERVESGEPGVGGFASLNNVLKRNGGGVTDDPMESFILAETLKYQYLIQKESSEAWDVLGIDGKGGRLGFVYNTEAHPFAIAGKASRRGNG